MLSFGIKYKNDRFINSFEKSFPISDFADGPTL
jgi:hypothetical protein